MLAGVAAGFACPSMPQALCLERPTLHQSLRLVALCLVSSSASDCVADVSSASAVDSAASVSALIPPPGPSPPALPPVSSARNFVSILALHLEEVGCRSINYAAFKAC